MIENYERLFKALADKSRLKIISSLSKEPMYVELISERIGIKPSTVSHHLKKLEYLGLVSSKKDQYYTMYSLNKDKLNVHVMKAIRDIADDSESLEDRETSYRNKVIDTFIQDGKLTQIPVQLKKRRIILEVIADEFEFDKDYPEKEVNQMISKYHFDFCTIRREFIMERMFHRESGIYRRVK